VPRGAAPTPVGTPNRLDLGQPLTLDEARARLNFAVVMPGALGPPDEVYLREAPVGGQVALVYLPRPDLPATGTTGVGLLLTEFQGSFRGGTPIGKVLDPNTRLEDVTVQGVHGFWIDGDPHVFFYFDAQGRSEGENTRLAGNVLLWERAPLTLRLESGLTRDAAVHIADSIQ
jgi:hypothetical protein